jgi:hypothetical protein
MQGSYDWNGEENAFEMKERVWVGRSVRNRKHGKYEFFFLLLPSQKSHVMDASRENISLFLSFIFIFNYYIYLCLFISFSKLIQ